MKAFTRLQEEIIKKTDDESLFANHRLDRSDDDAYGFPYGSLLAATPDYFLNSGDVLLHDKDWPLHETLEQGVEALSLVTNKGLLVHSLGCSCRYDLNSRASIYGWLMILDCRMRGDIFAFPAVFLKPLIKGTNRYSRFNPRTLLMVRRTDGKATLEDWPKKLGHRNTDVDSCKSQYILSTSQTASLSFAGV